MKYSTFDTITVRQYQQLLEIGKSTDEDKDMQYVTILTGLTLTQVEDMRLDDYNAVCREVTKIFSNPPKHKPRRRIRVAGKRYEIIYNPRRLSPGRYIEINTWLAEGVIQNMHKIMTSLIKPVSFWGRGKSIPHSQLSEQVLDCRFSAVHSACVFFSLLWRNSIKDLVVCLEKEQESKMTPIQRIQMRKLLQIASDGYSAQNR